MTKYKKVNNERSEAIELIKLMDTIVKRNTWQIKSVGGESTLNTGDRRMFPDVLLYGDAARTQILQGWEIKMPDVVITNADFISDAQRKADVLAVNSCVIWNYASCVVFVKKNARWFVRRIREINHIRSRADVFTYKSDWEVVVNDILSELNNFFVSGEMYPSKLGDIVSNTVFIEILRRNKHIVAEYIKAESIKNTVIDAFVTHWWRNAEKEYYFDETDPFVAYAKVVLLNWINKITFANMIKGNHNPAMAVEEINENMTPVGALDIFAKITAKCDFFNIFEAIEYSDLLPRSAWADLTDYSSFLSENGIAQISQEVLQSVLENNVTKFKKSIAGIFSTPPKLAEILVKSGITDLTAPAIDPCCGTGTIAKEILAAKSTAIGVENAFATTYASDKSSFTLQISNIAMTRADAINLPSLLFCSNAFDLCENKEVEIIDPQSGDKRVHKLPRWGSVISNLPFVAFDQEGREESGHLAKLLECVHNESGINLSGRTDLYQAILFHLYRLLADNASVAVITSNSWLGTLAGRRFFRALNYYYLVESIVASGKGKWFDNADVITLMLFLKNKPIPQHQNANHTVNFGLIHKALPEISSDETALIVDSIKLRSALSPELLSFKSYTLQRIENLLDMNIALNSFFYNVHWLSEVKEILCPVTDLFDVFRGMKTGQDEIYYLRNEDDIDREYIGRVLKSAKSADHLIAQPDTYSIVCGKTIEELTRLGHRKTLEWIDRFKGHLNQSVPNKVTFWMNLSDGSLSGGDKIRLFTGMNPERRIFYGLLNEPAQINQRVIGFKPLSESMNLDLCHALLNSVIGVFYAEAIGFPKGLGALDNRAENVKNILMTDPRRLSESDASKILVAFLPLLSRKIMPTLEEYEQADRLNFEHVVAKCFGYSELFEQIKNSVLDMQRVRLSVRVC